MQFETTPWKLVPCKSTPKEDCFVIESSQGKVVLDQLSFSYFQILSGNKSVFQLVESCLLNHRIPSFQTIRSLAQNLSEKGILIEPKFIENEGRESWFKGLMNSFELDSESNGKNIDLKNYPFFRQLQPEIVNAFQAGAKVYNLPEKIHLIQDGSSNRDMYVLKEGLLAVSKKSQAGGRQHLAYLSEGAVFGEGAFLLGRPRAADVISVKPSVIIRIPWDDNKFQNMINEDVAQKLQSRIWVHHALLSSPLFSKLPTETQDQLAFSGSFRNWSAGQTVFKEGEDGRSASLITRGEFVVMQGPKAIRVLKQGDVFGEISLLASSGVRTATIIAQKDSEVLEIGFQEFYGFIGKHLELACMLEKIANERMVGDKRN